MGLGEDVMESGKLPAYFPVDHKASLSGYQVAKQDVEAGLAPWPVRRRTGVFIVLALAAWVVVLSPFMLIG